MARFSVFGFNILALFYVARAEPSTYGALGKSVTLSPPAGAASPITSVLWRHNDDYAVEWSTGEDVTRYRNFKGRTELDTTTGKFTINNMTQGEAGPYSLEINGVRLPNTYKVELIEVPKKPRVWPRPDTDTMELVCQGDVTNAGPVRFWWSLGDGSSFTEMEQSIVLPINETTKSIKTFTCRISNPVGEATSDAEKNPIFFSGEEAGGGGLAGLVAIPVILIVAFSAFLIWKNWAAIKSRLSGNGNGNGDVSPPPASQPLNDKNAESSSSPP